MYTAAAATDRQERAGTDLQEPFVRWIIPTTQAFAATVTLPVTRAWLNVKIRTARSSQTLPVL